jgi:prepilin-type processing-associated H-X9-DG protein
MADPSPDKPSRKAKGCGVFIIFLLFMYVFGCDAIGMMLSLWMPAVQAAREAARQAQCGENLKKIGSAIEGYRQKHGTFPPAFVADKDGSPMHSWRVLILPFLGEEKLFGEYRLDEPWDSPHNRALARKMPAVYRCPSEPDRDPSETSYAMIVGPHAISDGTTARRLSDIEDGGVNTIMVSEAANAAISWMKPRDLDTKHMLRESEVSSPHGVKFNVLFCDGKVGSVDEKSLKAMLSIDGRTAAKP